MSTKVTPYNIHVPSPKENNFFKKSVNLVSQIKFMIVLQALLGINRLFLLKIGPIFMRLFYLYSSLLFALTLYFMFVPDYSGGTYGIVKETTSIEYLFLIAISSFIYKGAIENLFKDLASFDDMLNISQESAVTIKIKRSLIWMLFSFAYCIFECVLFFIFLCIDLSPSSAMIYLTIVAHDSEQIFYVTLIRLIMIRVRILKGHIAKSFNTEKDTDDEEIDSVEGLSKNIDLDTTGMHRAYELLHKCADELNSAMSFPMIVMLFSSGLNTTIFLKKLFQTTQESNKDEMEFNIQLIYTSVRCLKYTVLVIIPCYYASVTTRQVMSIRTMLHNAVNTFRLEKIERRKIKAFFQLTQDNEFAYALWGVIRLSMSLPLNYASLCTTYLVIIIQFSKFID